jgi:colanic acid biosynthesis glycosyl transferase WcaI
MGTDIDMPDFAPEQKQRIVVCDRSGHPFQVQLSRELARRGHHLLHLYWSDFVTPHGLLDKHSADAPTFNIAGVSIGEPYLKNSFIKRRRQEQQFGSLAWEYAWAFQPDVFLSCNMPLDSQVAVSDACGRQRIRLVYWLQDIYGLAASSILASKMGLGGRLVGMYYEHLERRLLGRSDAIICISNEFAEIVESWRIPAEKCATIPNWAPVDEICVRNKQNGWARSLDLHDKKVVMYSGTLGFKHNIGMILAAAERMRSQDDVIFVVISEGTEAARLHALSLKGSLRNVEVLPFQPYERYSEVLGTADILTAFVDGDAGVYSIPSKVLSYLCAGRPIVLAAPEQNLASKTVVEAEAGLVVPADVPSLFAQAIADLLDDDARRAALGRSARKYAEARFDIGRIADKFEAILAPAAAVPPQRPIGLRRTLGDALAHQRWS